MDCRQADIKVLSLVLTVIGLYKALQCLIKWESKSTGSTHWKLLPVSPDIEQTKQSPCDVICNTPLQIADSHWSLWREDSFSHAAQLWVYLYLPQISSPFLEVLPLPFPSFRSQSFSHWLQLLSLKAALLLVAGIFLLPVGGKLQAQQGLQQLTVSVLKINRTISPSNMILHRIYFAQFK